MFFIEFSLVHNLPVPQQDGSYFERVPVPETHTRCKAPLLVCQNLNIDQVHASHRIKNAETGTGTRLGHQMYCSARVYAKYEPGLTGFMKNQ